MRGIVRHGAPNEVEQCRGIGPEIRDRLSPVQSRSWRIWRYRRGDAPGALVPMAGRAFGGEDRLSLFRRAAASGKAFAIRKNRDVPRRQIVRADGFAEIGRLRRECRSGYRARREQHGKNATARATSTTSWSP